MQYLPYIVGLMILLLFYLKWDHKDLKEYEKQMKKKYTIKLKGMN